MSSYNNTYHGAVFNNASTPDLLRGSMQLSAGGTATLWLGPNKGSAPRKFAVEIKGRQPAKGTLFRNKSKKRNAPVYKGRVELDGAEVLMAVFVATHNGERYYQFRPDNGRPESKPPRKTTTAWLES